MKLTLLGSGTALPDPERGPAGLLLQVDDRSWLIDGGSGTLQRCARAGVDPRQLDGGIYSHHHPDHCADLVPLLFAMRVGPPPRTRDYPIWGGTGLAALASRLQAAWGHWITPGTGALLVNELPLHGESVVQLAPKLRMRVRPAAHGAGALHLRFESRGRSVVFSGDTGPSQELETLTRGADLLICECAGSDDEPVPGHLFPRAVADLVRSAQPSEVWLTHMYPQVDPDRATAAVAATGVPARHAADLDVWSG